MTGASRLDVILLLERARAGDALVRGDLIGGMTDPKIAAALEVSVCTVERDRRIARAWLNSELGVEGVG
jgi:FixJ family two-component response regulator